MSGCGGNPAKDHEGGAATWPGGRREEKRSGRAPGEVLLTGAENCALASGSRSII